ncbi:hypothetical protein IHE44_0003837 [Lamprotornis superbus]|uniref:receptor protein-tyrosine kinase n=1 Tax=Lamprotornis superbus TaxID=245042 RepID=A0A835TUH2_9PASS|nr:hypothetical protein IHE44_0003837 [Lamprotornis superbus]
MGSASPVISPALPTLIVNTGDPVLLHCSGESEVAWNSKKNTFSNHSTSTLSIPKATYRNTGTYSCRYVNSSDKGTAAIHLFVRDPDNVWYTPQFRVRGIEGGNVDLPCLITAPEYGSSVTLIMDDVSPLPPGTSYSFSAEKGIRLYNVQSKHKGFYRCQAQINGKIKNSSRIRLVMEEALEKPVSVVMDPADHVRIVGEPFQVTCTVIAPSHKYDIRWVTAANTVMRTKRTDFENGNYFISDTLSVAAVTMEDSGKYICVANNSAGFRNASTMLQVVEKGYVHLIPGQATSQEVALGESVKLQVHIKAYPKLVKWFWEHRNPLKSSKPTILKGETISGNNWYNNTLFLNRLKEGEGGFYTFYAFNNHRGSFWFIVARMERKPQQGGCALPLVTAFTVYVTSPTASPRVCKIKVPADNSSILQCTAIGYPAPRIEWYQCPAHSDRYSEDYRLIQNDSRPQVVNMLPFQEVEVESIILFKELGSVMALPNKLFNPVLSTCIGALVLLLLLLLFLLYKYNQVRFPAAGTIQLGGTRQTASCTSLPPSFPLEFPAAEQSSCTQPSAPIPPLPWSFNLVPHREVGLGQLHCSAVLSNQGSKEGDTVGTSPSSTSQALSATALVGHAGSPSSAIPNDGNKLLPGASQKPKYQVRWKIIEACEGNNYIFIDPTQLPYNEKWEFPRNNLQFGKTLGAGAFGKVVEATAFGLGKEDSVLKVAVKMLKSSADTDEQEALMSELKIMSHLGHHENIVNLLGACTCGGPILVITEYCRYGDLLNFLRKKSESIIIQDSALDTSLDSAADYKNIELEKKYIRSDSGFSSQGLETYVEMRPVSSSSSAASDSAQVRGRSSEAEDEAREDLRPLNLSDLLQFSSQVAQGMAFLASKNCIHRDLAARNVLISDGRVAKICDFGLARDIMNDSNYVVKGNDSLLFQARLPVKWMAPESIFDCIYTVQSDVWSYGILLWEIFSLGKSPYPGMVVNSKFYSMVKQGYQMARPDFAPLEMYRIMQACWSLEPTRRPTFDQIGCFIQKELEVHKEQDYTNLPSGAEEDSGCDTSGCCEESCEQEESGQPLLKGNNYQFC